MDGDGSFATALSSISKEEEFSKKLTSLRKCIRIDIYAADLKWSLFVGAVQSYRCDSCLHPFPPLFMKDGEKDIERLRAVMTHMPSLPTLLTLLEDPVCDLSNRGPLIDLLHWVFIEQNEPSLETVSKDEFNDVLSKVPSEKCAVPNLIFRVHYRLNPDRVKKFQDASKNHNTIFAYHGSRLENFFSILNFGLLKTLNKKYVYGHGIYLSSEMMVSLNYSPMGFGWGGSILGSELSCLAICEMIDHRDVICQLPPPDMEACSARAIAKDSMAGEIPDKHFLAQNSELVMVRYLLVYAKNPQSINCQDDSKGSMIGWLNKHKLFTLMVGYVLLLGAVGMSNNPTVMRYYRMLIRRWSL